MREIRVHTDLEHRVCYVARFEEAVYVLHALVSQPRVSDLMRGKIDRLSVDSLVEMLGRIGMRVDFTTTRRRAGRKPVELPIAFRGG